ncbi:hypothetical protein [Agrococcus sp. HG114]|uniref:hypothetical protein n=1 Tax=Agrococcus sp. HG114 TaxID=2969757 RepID=UPI00215A6B58|nr:hypothetical protein [Agrococcus sp. HG114]MCR8670438.1 hypothetical protein [Agrococcus sp. HG114]
MSAAPRAARSHLRLLGLIAGALFGAAGVLTPFALMLVISLLAGLTSLGAQQWPGLLLGMLVPIAAAAVSGLWLRRAGIPSAGRVTAAAGTLAALAGLVSTLLLTPLLIALQAAGVAMADTEAMALLPALAVVLGALAGVLLWPALALSLGGAPAGAAA